MGVKKPITHEMAKIPTMVGRRERLITEKEQMRRKKEKPIIIQLKKNQKVVLRICG